MKRYDLLVIGAGPAGLSAAIAAARCGLKAGVFDENEKPGGQLFKQIHKFFGSKEHHAKIRGINIGTQLLKEATENGVEVHLNATVAGLFKNREILVCQNEKMTHYKGDSIVIATGAAENMYPFEGWTLPGVIGAGAAQTMMNIHGIKPGDKVLMLGTGNVGLVVSYQLLQAGCEVVALVDASPKVGGYGVHAAKVARCGIPFYLRHTITKAEGKTKVKGVVIQEVDERFQPVPGTEKYFEADTICISVGLSPMTQLLKMSGCAMMTDAGGNDVPVTDEEGHTSYDGVFAAGDVSGIEEASSAMIEGEIAGISAAAYTGFLSEAEKTEKINDLKQSLEALRQGMFAPENRGKEITETEEGIPVSEHLLQHGFLDEEEIERFPGCSHQKGVHPVIECTQNIPCNPCQDVCPKNCIRIGSKITALPVVEENSDCIGCGMCVAACPGQAIFLIDENYDENNAAVSIPYEFLPLPEKGEKGMALDRSGIAVCKAEVIGVKKAKNFDHTAVVTIKVPKEKVMSARFFQKEAMR